MTTQKNPSRAYKFCWNHVVLPKDGCFVWLALKHRIPTSDRLTKLNIAPPFKCVLCNEEYELVDHLFVTCSFAYDCWVYVLRKTSLLYSSSKQPLGDFSILAASLFKRFIYRNLDMYSNFGYLGYLVGEEQEDI